MLPEPLNPGIMAYCTFYDTPPCLILTLDFCAANAGFLHCKPLFALFYTLYDTIIILSFSITCRLPAKMMNEGKIAGMNRLHGDLMRVIHDVNPEADISMAFYGACQARTG